MGITHQAHKLDFDSLGWVPIEKALLATSWQVEDAGLPTMTCFKTALLDNSQELWEALRGELS